MLTNLPCSEEAHLWESFIVVAMVDRSTDHIWLAAMIYEASEITKVVAIQIDLIRQFIQ